MIMTVMCPCCDKKIWVELWAYNADDNFRSLAIAVEPSDE